MPPRPAVEVRLARGSDAEAVASFLPASFGQDPLHRSLFNTPGPGVILETDPGKHANEVHALRVARTRAGVRRHYDQAPGKPVYTLVALLDGQVIGMALWYASHGSIAEEPENPLDVFEVPNTTPPPFWNAAVDKDIEEKLTHSCRQLFGTDEPRDCWHLRALAVDAAAQGRGAGGALVAWGTARADEQQAKCYVESSDAGLAVYRKAGFADASDWIEFKHGGRRLPMVRPARGPS